MAGPWHSITSVSHLPLTLGSHIIQWLWDKTWWSIPTCTICLTLYKFLNPSELYFSSLEKWRYFLFVFPPNHELLQSWDTSLITSVLPVLTRHQLSSTCLLNCRVVGTTELDNPPKFSNIVSSTYVKSFFQGLSLTQYGFPSAAIFKGWKIPSPVSLEIMWMSSVTPGLIWE